MQMYSGGCVMQIVGCKEQKRVFVGFHYLYSWVTVSLPTSSQMLRRLCYYYYYYYLLLLLLLYIQLTISYLIGWKRTVNFQNQCLGCHLTADCTIIVSRSLKVMGNHQSGGYLPSSFEARPINTIFYIDVFIKVLCIQYRSGSQEV